MKQAVKKFIDFTDFTFIPSENMKVHIFKVKDTWDEDDAIIKLIETGFFDGTEKFIRKTSTKGYEGTWSNDFYTIIHNDGRSFSWESSTSGGTNISKKIKMEQEIIDNAIKLHLSLLD
jgi:hypothetical protein